MWIYKKQIELLDKFFRTTFASPLMKKNFILYELDLVAKEPTGMAVC
jgi:hypothetical protein